MVMKKPRPGLTGASQLLEVSAGKPEEAPDTTTDNHTGASSVDPNLGARITMTEPCKQGERQ